MPTPLLNLPETSPTQDDKTTTMNDGLLALEQATQQLLSLDVSLAGVTLSVDQWTRNIVFACNGATADQALTIPLSMRMFAVKNTGTAHTIEVGGTSGATVDIPPTSLAVLYCDGTNVVPISALGFAGLVVTDLGGVSGSIPLSGNFAYVSGTLTLSGVEFTANKGIASGYASLDGTGRVPFSELPAGLQEAVHFAGNVNASTMITTLGGTISSGTMTGGSTTLEPGMMFKVATAGTVTVDTISDWEVGDQMVWSGISSTWNKFIGLSSEVLTVAGRTGHVVLTKADITDLGSLAGFNTPGSPGVLRWTGSTIVADSVSPDGVVKATSGTLSTVSALAYSDLPAEVSYMPISVFHPEILIDGEEILFWPASQDLIIPANMAGATIIFDDASDYPTGTITLDVSLQHSGVWSSISSWTIDPAGVLTIAGPGSATAFPTNDGIKITGPLSHDATFGNFALSVRLMRASVADIIVSESNAYVYGEVVWGAGASAQVGTLRIEPSSDFNTHITDLEFDNGGTDAGTISASVFVNGSAVVFNQGTTTTTTVVISAPGTATVFSGGAVTLGDAVDMVFSSLSGLINDGGVVKLKGTLDP